jgi:hypothetical protein
MDAQPVRHVHQSNTLISIPPPTTKPNLLCHTHILRTTIPSPSTSAMVTAFSKEHIPHIDWEDEATYTDMAAAETCYYLMLNTVDAGHDAANFLMGESEKAGVFRSMLLGLPAERTTTWDQFYKTRFFFECRNPNQVSSVDTAAGKATRKNDKRNIDRNKLTELLNESVKPLLMELSSSVRSKFMSGVTSEMRPGPLFLLHGLVLRANNIPPNHPWPNLELRRYTLRLCIQLADTEEVTLRVMKEACRMCASLPSSHLEGAKQFFGRNGQLGGRVPGTCAPVVTGIRLRIEGRPKDSLPEVVLISGGATNPELMKCLLELYTTGDLQFIRGKRGRDGSIVRVVTSANDPKGMIFQNGSGGSTVQYPVFAAHNKERELMDSIVTFVRSVAPPNSPGTRYECNLLHVLITKLLAGGYGAHDDFSVLLGRLAKDVPDAYTTEEGNALPTQADTITVTLVWCTKAGATCRITWSKDGVDIGSIDTCNNDIHLQGPGTQYNGIQHRVELLTRKEAVDATDKRIIISARVAVVASKIGSTAYDERKEASQIPLDNEPLSFKEHGCLNGLQGIHGIGSPLPPHDTCPSTDSINNGGKRRAAADDLASGSVAKKPRTGATTYAPFFHDKRFDRCTNLGSKLNNDGFQQISVKGFERMAEFVAVRPLLSEPERIAEVLMSFDCQAELMKLGYTVHVEETDTREVLDGFFSIESSEGDRRYPVRGSWYDKSTVLAAAKITNNSKSHPPCRTGNDFGCNVFVQNCECRNETSDVPAHLGDPTLPVTIFGSGGAAKTVGETCEPTVASVLNSEEETWATGASPQSIAKNAINAELLKVVLRSGVIALFQTREVYEHTFKDQHKYPTTMASDRLFFVGYFIADKFETRKLDHEEIATKYRGSRPMKQHLYRYMEKKHFAITLAPVPIAILSLLLSADGTAKPLKRLLVPVDCGSAVGIRLEKVASLKSALRLSVGCLSSKSVRQSYIAKGEWKEFTDGIAEDEDEDDDEGRKADDGDAENGGETGPRYREETAAAEAGPTDGEDATARDIDDGTVAEQGKPAEVGGPTQQLVEDGGGTGTPVDKDGASSPPCAAVPRDRVETASIVRLMIFLNVAGLLRASNSCLAPEVDLETGAADGPRVGQPLVGEHHLGAIIQTTPTPMPNRGLDVVEHFVRQCTELDLEARVMPPLDPANRLYRTDQPMLFQDTLFRAIVMRVLGRVMPMHLYRQFRIKHKQDTGCLPIPTSDQTKQFLEFLHLTMGHRGATFSRWISRQHAGSVPATLRDAGGFDSFLVALAKDWRKKCDIVAEQSSRKECLLKLVEIAGNAMPYKGTDRVRMTFVLAQALASTEEMFESPFGEVTEDSVVVGHGGQVCGEMLTGTTAIGRSRVVWLNEYGTISKKILDDYRGLNDDELCCLLLRKDGKSSDGKSEIRHMLTGRLLSFTDVEVTLCKGKIFAYENHPSRMLSVRKQFTKPYCYPLPEMAADLMLSADEKRLHLKGIDAFRALTSGSTPQITLPDLFSVGQPTNPPSTMATADTPHLNAPPPT